MSEASFFTDTEVDTRLSNENGDHERFAHYVPKDTLMEALINGWPVVALCGKIWIPSRDPEKFPICPMCKELYDEMQGDGNL
jgi:hypothetical protein